MRTDQKVSAVFESTALDHTNTVNTGSNPSWVIDVW